MTPNHLEAVHNTMPTSLSSEFGSNSNESENKKKKNKTLEELESRLLPHERKEEKAHRKTRGPYRKSYRIS
jgi:hypothetical protein